MQEKILKSSRFVLVILALIISNGYAQNKAEKIDALLQKYEQLGQFNGSALVAQNGQVVHKGGYGMANFEWEIPNAADTKHRLGSISKQFTAMLIMQLAEEGKVDLKAPITHYLPNYRKDTGDKVTVHQLLIHTSGIPSYTRSPKFREERIKHYSVSEFVKKFCSEDFEFEPGSRYRYNNSGYFLLGAIIENIENKPYEVVLKERIFNPLNMHDSGYDHHHTILKNRATGYEKRGKGLINSPYLSMSLPYAAGALYSTVEDLLKWDQGLYGQKLISETSKKQMFTAYIQDYGYGWHIRKQKLNGANHELDLVGHGGGINGFNTLITRERTSKTAIVLLNNTGGALLEEITTTIFKILNNLPYTGPKPFFHDAFITKLNNNGLEEAVAFFGKQWKASPRKLRFSERQINTMGYQLLQAKKIKEAIAVFKINSTCFPESFNTWDSLAEGYMVNGQNDLAIKFYKKSVEMNPKNQHGKDMIKKLIEN